MSELTKILRSEITRVAKREARWLVAPTRKSSIVAKQELVALKRRVAELERLGMSAEDFGKLLGVSSQSIYNWEHGTAKPRSALLDKLAVVRAIGKREALARLRSLNGGAKRA